MESIPDSAACNEGVKLVKKRGLQGLTGFVNGILRNIIREKDKISFLKEDIFKYYSVKYSIPEWIIKSFIRDYGEKNTEKMLNTFYVSEDSATTVRVNTSRISTSEVMEMLNSQKISTEISRYADNAIIIRNYEKISSIDAFKKGYVQVQDISSMLVGQISGVKSGDICIDMCAAPGGKSIHIADLLNGTGKVYSRDISDKKTLLIKENVERCGLENVVIQVVDATEYIDENVGMADVVIADVPCSGMGILKKKTDIKYRITEDTVKNLSILSRKILTNAVRYLKKGGILIFSTCTMNKIENDDNRQWLIDEMGLKPVSIEENLSEDLLCECNNRECAKNGYLQLFMTDKYDGFYISKFIKEDSYV
jgi:16S rRNA (cytosine967-C5)-methyltransferase